jgi:hypothetical protein
MIDYSSISIQELSRIENLPQSVEEFCNSNKLYDLKKLIDYWNEHGTFSTLKDCVSTMDVVLSSVANKYALLPVLVKENLRGEESLPVLIRRFDTVRKIILCQLIAVLTDQYGTKIRYLLANHSWPGKKGEGLFDFLYGDRINFLNSDVTTPTVSKIMQLKNRISCLLPLLAGNTNKAVSEAHQSVLGLLSSPAKIWIFAPKKAISANGKIALFKLIEYLVEGGLFFSAAERRQFWELYRNNTAKSKIEINSEHGAPPHQHMRDTMLNDFRSHFICLSFMRPEDLADYDLDLYPDVLLIDNAFVNRINAREYVHFTRTFYENVFSSLLDATHSLLDGVNREEDGRRTTRQRYKWKASYVVRKELSSIFNFISFVEEVAKLARKESAVNQTIDIDKFLNGFMNEKDMRKIHRIRKTCLVLLSQEFSLCENKEGLIVIPPSLGSRYKTILCKILEWLMLPASLPFLLARLKEIEPDMALSPSDIRSFMIADKEKFFCLGETDAYGLADWRRSGKKFRTLSTEALATEFLRRADAPMYVDDILSYIRQFRLITPSELLEVLCKSNGGMFIIFKNDIVGLKHKNYAGEIVYLSPTK